jgi:mono/diheme cytochrome c family protein
MNKVIVSTCIHPNQARESSLKILLTINKIRIALFFILAFTQTLPVFADAVKKPESEISERSGALIALQVCSGCHGKTVKSISSQYPHLAGQQKEYLRIQLAQFKEHLPKLAFALQRPPSPTTGSTHIFRESRQTFS